MNNEEIAVKVDNVSKSFDDVLVLNHVNLEVQKSEILGLAGQSGSGKSTLLRCIQKLDAIDEGTIECNGRTGFMFQDFQLFPHMTVLQNVVYAPILRKFDAIKNDSESVIYNRAMDILTELHIKSKANEHPKTLSGGQKQRVALARSLMTSPNILLCDEPTSGLDSATVDDVVLLLKSLNKTGVTMLIASHDLNFLMKVSDRTVLLRKGKVK